MIDFLDKISTVISDRESVPENVLKSLDECIEFRDIMAQRHSGRRINLRSIEDLYSLADMVSTTNAEFRKRNGTKVDRKKLTSSFETVISAGVDYAAGDIDEVEFDELDLLDIPTRWSTARTKLRLELSTVPDPGHSFFGLQSIIGSLLKEGHSVSLITFNYDLVLERMLLNLGKRASYAGNVGCFPEKAILDEANLALRGLYLASILNTGRSFSPPQMHLDGEVELIKLHGSINWHMSRGQVSVKHPRLFSEVMGQRGGASQFIYDLKYLLGATNSEDALTPSGYAIESSGHSSTSEGLGKTIRQVLKAEGVDEERFLKACDHFFCGFSDDSNSKSAALTENSICHNPSRGFFGLDHSDTPLIVPPSWQKAVGSHHISAQWAAAYRVIAQAHRLHFVGYSWPATDQHVRHLLSVALASAGYMKKVNVIGKQDLGSDAIALASQEQWHEMIARYQNLLGDEFGDRLNFIYSGIESLSMHDII